MGSRFGEKAAIHYRNVEDPAIRAELEDAVGRIEEAGLLYPVTVIDGVPTHDGAISYPAILRAVHNKLAEASTREA